MTVFTPGDGWIDQESFVANAARAEFDRRIQPVPGVFAAFGAEPLQQPQHHRTGAVTLELMSKDHEVFQLTIEDATGNVSWVWNATENRLGKVTDLVPDDELVTVLNAVKEATLQAVDHERRTQRSASRRWRELREEQLGRPDPALSKDSSPQRTTAPVRTSGRPNTGVDQATPSQAPQRAKTATGSSAADAHRSRRLTNSTAPENGLPVVPREELVAVLRDAHAWFRGQAEGSWVPDYLNRRNLYPEMIAAGLGYAPDGFRPTLTHLRGRGHSDEAIEAAGLARRSAKNGQLYDVFRDRLMFPVTEPDSRTVVGFTGRIGEGADPELPKYWNTRETSLFKKGSLLYALGEDRAELESGFMPMFVEGPTDRLAVRIGRRDLKVTGLASLGTAITRQQLRMVVDVVGRGAEIGFAMDPDTAGRNAVFKAWEKAAEEGLEKPMLIRMPDGKDPAELIRAGRGNQLREAIEHRQPMLYGVTDERIKAHRWAGVEFPVQRAAVAEQIMGQDMHRVPPDEAGRYVAYVAKRLDLELETVSAIAAEAVARGPVPEREVTGKAEQQDHQGRADAWDRRTSTLDTTNPRQR